MIVKYDHKLDPQGKNIRAEINTIQEKLGKRKLRGVKLSIDIDAMDLF